MQSNYVAIFSTTLPKSTNELIGCVRSSVALWAEGELKLPRFLPTDGIEERKEDILKMDLTETGIVALPSRNQVLITVDIACFNTYIGTDLGHIYDCYIANIYNE